MPNHGWKVLLAVIAIVIVGLIGYWQWDWLNDGESNSATLRNLALIVFGVIGFALAGWRTSITERNTKIAERNTRLAAENIEIGNKNAEIADRNSVTDTFTKALEQLGSGSKEESNIEVRIGAIYGLEKLSQSNDDYYQAIIDILCSYVQQNSPTFSRSDLPDAISQDVQAAMTVIGRRIVREFEAPLILELTNLRLARLMEADLEEADLTGAYLRGADLRGAKLEGANLTGAKNLTCEQLQTAQHWEESYRDPDLACGADIPSFPSIPDD